ncbi:MAG: cysteine desulfurase [Anaerolineae bacterium]|nr:cysteine desulfurase [Anaerolineae bacterium]
MSQFGEVDFSKIPQDFPILQRETRPGVRLVYLDSAATSQKPEAVISAMDAYYRNSNANIHRGVHTLAEEATSLYEESRKKVAAFIGAAYPYEVIFTRNTTEAINLVAYSWARKNLKQGDIIVLTEMEHHSNLVPWQILAEERDIRLEFVPVTPEGFLDLEVYRQVLALQPRLVSFMHVSNVLGTINPVKEMIQAAHEAGAVVMLDAAQSVPHMPVNVQELDVDFMAFSAHKMLGPTGIGALYGKQSLLEAMPPFLGGGDMIKKVYLRTFVPNDLPHKFEAGTPAIAEAIGFGAAVDYLSAIGMENVAKHEQEIVSYAINTLLEIPEVHLIGPLNAQKGAVTSFTYSGVHPHDVAQILDHEGIAVRAGHHCAMPLHQKYNLPATSRASFYIYNTLEDVNLLVKGLEKVKRYFG